MPRVLSDLEKEKMRQRYANLSIEQRKKELDRMLELKRKHRSDRRNLHIEHELKRREVFLKHVESIEVAWAAGFWEGEGSVSKRHFLATQKHLWPLERLQVSFGGRIGGPSKDGCFHWYVCGEQGRAFFAAIAKHLSPRRIEQISKKFIGQPKLGMPSRYKPILKLVKDGTDA